MRKKPRVDKRIIQVEGKIKTLQHLLNGQSTSDQFKGVLKDLEEVVGDLKSILEREMDPTRYG
tara:strand:+ start:1051 stop:1239 length:189 start_codon:yes stop_codon:yes gene_type:complete